MTILVTVTSAPAALTILLGNGVRISFIVSLYLLLRFTLGLWDSAISFTKKLDTVLIFAAIAAFNVSVAVLPPLYQILTVDVEAMSTPTTSLVLSRDLAEDAVR